MNPALPKTWYYVYLLGSKTTDRIYIGCTNNLQKRLKEHNDAKVFSTRKMLPVELIYCEAYRDKHNAFEREKCLKKYGSGLAKIKGRIGIKKEGRAG